MGGGGSGEGCEDGEGGEDGEAAHHRQAEIKCCRERKRERERERVLNLIELATVKWCAKFHGT